MSTTTTELKPNIGVFTDPQHNLWLDSASPSVEEIVKGDHLHPGEVVVQIRSTGICGYVSLFPPCTPQGNRTQQPYRRRSDVHFWHAGCIGPMIVTDKHILGHESAGEVYLSYLLPAPTTLTQCPFLDLALVDRRGASVRHDPQARR